MGHEPQTFTAPDGTEMVVLPAADYEKLKLLAEDGEDRLVAGGQLNRLADGEGTMPAAVLDLILDQGLTAVAAWRRYRDMTQVALARAVGCSQVWLSRIESGGGYGTPKMRRALAQALEAPVWALEDEAEGKREMKSSLGTGLGRKYLPLQNYLRTNGNDRVVLSFDAIAEMVGNLPRSAFVHQAWWGNHAGNSQATGWMGASYLVEVDQRRKMATFNKFTKL
jgi:transcriptional regulator with XRE-family HTH domain